VAASASVRALEWPEEKATDAPLASETGVNAVKRRAMLRLGGVNWGSKQCRAPTGPPRECCATLKGSSLQRNTVALERRCQRDFLAPSASPDDLPGLASRRVHNGIRAP
jgi:hypothetical protein